MIKIKINSKKKNYKKKSNAICLPLFLPICLCKFGEINPKFFLLLIIVSQSFVK